MNYFGNRQNPLNNISEDEINKVFKKIVDTFGAKWLESDNNHPLQKLWNRKDYLATNELFTLASALLKMDNIDSKWLKHQIKLIKGKDDNNIRGAIFEILALSYFNTDDIKVNPAKISQCGYDGTLVFRNNSKINISLKNYGYSTHNELFTEECKVIEKYIVSNMLLNKIKTLLVYIEAIKDYPNKSDWEDLKLSMPEILRTFKGQPIFISIKDTWIVGLNKLDDYEHDFHPNFSSYTLLITSPYHKNEELNMLSKLDSACANLSKYSVHQDDSNINIVMVHLPPNASINSCGNWANDYFSNYPDKPISSIMLYQPTVVTNLKENSTSINHCITICENESIKNWKLKNAENIIHLEMPVGIVSTEPSFIKLLIGDKELMIDNKYFYQSGNHYKNGKVDKDGSIVGNITKLAPGVFEHSVLKVFPHEKEMVVSGHFPPFDELLIV